MRYEYKTILSHDSPHRDESMLNDWGVAGWQVAAFRASGIQSYYVLMRPVAVSRTM